MDPREVEMRDKFPLETRVAVIEAQLRHIDANIEKFKAVQEDMVRMKTRQETNNRLMTICLTICTILVGIFALLVPHLSFK